MLACLSKQVTTQHIVADIRFIGMQNATLAPLVAADFCARQAQHPHAGNRPCVHEAAALAGPIVICIGLITYDLLISTNVIRYFSALYVM